MLFWKAPIYKALTSEYDLPKCEREMRGKAMSIQMEGSTFPHIIWCSYPHPGYLCVLKEDTKQQD